MPIYGVEQYICKAAEYLFKQDYPNIEFVFVNDGTKDRSIERLEELINSKYSHLLPQIKIIHKENGGLPAARRTGIEHATGDYVYNVDSDDWLAEGSIAKIAKKIEETNADVIYFNMVKEYATRSKLKRDREYTNDQKDIYIRNMYNHHSFASLCNKCIRRSLYTNYKIYTPKYGYAEDCFVTTQLVGYASTIAFLDEYVYHYRKTNPNSMTAQRIRKRKKEYALNFLDLYSKYKNLPNSQNPIAPIMDDVAMQMGWYSIMYNFKFFKEYPWLAKEVRKAKMHFGTDVWIVAQLLTKLVAIFK